MSKKSRAGAQGGIDILDGGKAQTPQGEAPTGQAAHDNAAGLVPTVNGEVAKETKSQKFTRLVNDRLPKALKRLDQLASLANRNQYEWTAGQMESLIGRLYARVEDLARAYQGVKKTDNYEPI